MPKYDYPKEPKKEQIVAELVLTEREVAEMLGVDRKDVYFRVTHEMTREHPPWAVAKIQAVKVG